MKAHSIFSAIVFLWAALFSSDNFANPKSSEGPPGLCKMYVNKIEEKNLTGHAFITAKLPYAMSINGHQINLSNNQYIVAAAHLAFDGSDLLKRSDSGDESAHVRQVNKLLADCGGVKLELQLEDSISRVGLPSYSYNSKCQKPKEFARKRVVESGCDMGIFSINERPRPKGRGIRAVRCGKLEKCKLPIFV